MLLKVDHGDNGKDEEGGGAAAKIGHTEFISHTIWSHKLDFDDWKKRCVFGSRRSHQARIEKSRARFPPPTSINYLQSRVRCNTQVSSRQQMKMSHFTKLERGGTSLSPANDARQGSPWRCYPLSWNPLSTRSRTPYDVSWRDLTLAGGEIAYD